MQTEIKSAEAPECAIKQIRVHNDLLVQNAHEPAAKLVALVITAQMTVGADKGVLHHVFGEVNGKKGAWGHAVAGMLGRDPKHVLDADLPVAIEVITDAPIVRDLIPKLKRAGASGIIEYPLNKVVY